MSNCMSIAIGGGGSSPSRTACMVSRPERWRAPSAVTCGSYQSTVRERGSPQSAWAAASSAVTDVVLLGQTGQAEPGGGQDPLGAGGRHRLAAGAADPGGVDDVVGVPVRRVVQLDRRLVGQPPVAPLHQALEHGQQV